MDIGVYGLQIILLIIYEKTMYMMELIRGRHYSKACVYGEDNL